MKGERKVLRYTMQLESDPETIFPLLCPVREYEWIESWECEMMFSVTGFAELDGIFRTLDPASGLEDTWVISRYESPALVEFVRWNSHRVIHYSISLKALEPGRTESEWRQVVTGLGEEGNKSVRDLDGKGFETMCRMEERMLNHFLKTGERLAQTDLVPARGDDGS
jgi:hypothetical protein